MHLPHQRRRPGFKLVELLLVLGIIFIVLSLAGVVGLRLREASARTTCLSKMRQIGIACHNYQDSHGSLPPGSGIYGNWPSAGFADGSVFFHLLPMCEMRREYTPPPPGAPSY